MVICAINALTSWLDGWRRCSQILATPCLNAIVRGFPSFCGRWHVLWSDLNRPEPIGAPLLVFDEIKAYMNFTEDDAARIVEVRECVKDEFGSIVGAFYTALNANPRTRSVFEGPEQVERLRGTLHLWLDDIFSGVYDEAYFKRHNRIGLKHVEVGLLPHFMFGAMNIVRTEITHHVIICEELESADLELHIASIDKLLDLELTIMLQSYWDNMMEAKLKVPAALASGLAHEIRNPLNTLALNITLLERRVRNLEDEGLADLLESMRSEIRRITGLTTEIMDFAKPIDLNPTWHDANELVRTMRQSFDATMEASRIEFVGEVVGDEQIFCDLDRMKQSIINLLSNAIEAVEGGGEITLRVESDEQTGTTVTVTDSGHGMPATEQHKMFDLFFTSKSSGTGLGLPIVKKIVEAHEGAVEVFSRVGRGTTFSIYLPRPVRKGPSEQSERV